MADNPSILMVREFLAGRSERALVIVGAAQVDDALRDMLIGFLAPSTNDSDELFDGDAPLATFSARIRLAFRLNLIDRSLARGCNLIRKIRNSFAHNAESAQLETSPHREWVSALFDTFAHLVNDSLNEVREDPQSAQLPDPVLRFIVVSAMIALIIRKMAEFTPKVSQDPSKFAALLPSPKKVNKGNTLPREAGNATPPAGG
ncbi:MAG: hypothetical protein QOF78_4079 [Phycisphaerales bacterium]|jgi:hypothetical protein|nr:hypothetical protein [Phycisphaerales bacterium]